INDPMRQQTQASISKHLLLSSATDGSCSSVGRISFLHQTDASRSVDYLKEPGDDFCHLTPKQ
ncbi:hypothetical protein, partial [Candidatus Ichthyocystis sparus]|uniref:hypothetical protein n=1 Tax=Candidatus Ichthyocystis sparus TaxID=1561004 RepID=UPI001F5F4E30